VKAVGRCSWRGGVRYHLEELHVLFVRPVIGESRRRARSVIRVGALALATTAKLRQIESVMHLHLKSEKSEHRQHWATEASEGESVECRHGPAQPPRQPIGSSCRLDRRRWTWSDRTRRIPGCKRAYVIRIYEVSRATGRCA